jgi:energy-coupling factor transporter ATP-binding protein EcfA2
VAVATPHPARTPGDSPLGRLAQDPLGTLTRWGHLAAHLLLSHLPLSITAAVLAITLAVAIRRALGRWRHNRLTCGARVVQVRVPPQVDACAAAVFWANLIGLLRPRWRRWALGQPHVAFEYAWDGPELHIQLWVPGPIPATLIARAIEAAWPAARTTITTPTPPIPQPAVATGGVLRLARPDHHPIATDHKDDPTRALLGAASGIGPNQSAVVQVLARPVTGRRLARGHRAAATLRGTTQPTLIGRLLDILTPTASTAAVRPGAVAAAHPERAGEIRAILEKAAAPRFAVTIRYAAATTYTPDEQASRAWVRGRAHALASAFAVFSGRNHFDRHRLHDPTHAMSERRMGRGDLLSVAELAAIAHLPYDPAVPGLSRAGANAVPPPPSVAAGGKGCKLLGDTDAGPARPIAIRVADARQHLHVLGATGAGKSTLLAHMILADANAGRAAVVIDPRGDLINDLLDRLPEKAAGRVWLIDPDTTPPPALGVLSGTDPNLASDNLVGIFHRIFADSWGPRTDDILRSAVLTLQQTPGATLADIPRLLTEEPYRIRATRRLTDEILAGFWDWYSGLSPDARSNAIGPVMNKLRHFLLRPFVRAVVGTPGPGLTMGHLLDHGGILLVRVPKGTLGDDTARLLGSFVVAKVWETITARARHKETTRRDASLFIDEAHSFLNLPHGIEEMLAEARAYRLSVVLAHQNLAQFPPAMRDAVAANARNKIIFAVSPHDARELTAAMWPNLTDHDLANLGAYQAAARLIAANQETPAFTFTTRPLPDPAPGRAELLHQAARVNAETTRRLPSLPDPRRDEATRQPTSRDAQPDPALRREQAPSIHPPA